MVQHASALVVCRTYPHVDLAESGEASAVVLERLAGKGPLYKAMRRTDFLVPLTSQCTLIEPANSIYRAVAEAEQGDVSAPPSHSAFPPADIVECGPAIVTYGTSQRAADEAADRLLALVNEQERAFAGKIWQPGDAVAYARAKGNSASNPIVLADTQDNPGAGGTSDTVGLLRALIDGRAEGAVFANLCDPKSAEAAHRAGVGAQITLALGGWARRRRQDAVPGHVHGGGDRRRQFPRHRTVLSRQPHAARPDGGAEEGRRARGAVQPQAAMRRPGDAAPCRDRARSRRSWR